MRAVYVAGCCVPDGSQAYQNGYNDISETLIRQKIGPDVFERLYQQAQAKLKNKRFYVVHAADTLTKIAR